jgi:hypothetical protein
MDGHVWVGLNGMGICIWGLDTVSGLHRLVGCACYTKVVSLWCCIFLGMLEVVGCVGILKIPCMQLNTIGPTTPHLNVESVELIGSLG